MTAAQILLILLLLLNHLEYKEKILVRLDRRIQSETLHKIDRLFAALILKSSCANLVWEFIKKTLRNITVVVITIIIIVIIVIIMLQ